MKLLAWINDSITTGEHNNLMHNALYGVEKIAFSLKRANALESLKQLKEVNAIINESYVEAVKDILKLEGYEITYKS